ncbi:MAG: 2-phospho-L-lactate guanylyltransferase [Pseudomonadota bacterium]
MSGRDAILVVVPMKDPFASKSRLSDTMSVPQRAALARLLFRQTLRVLAQAKEAWDHFDIAVVTASDAAAEIAAAVGVPVLTEGAPSSLSKAADRAAAWAAADGYKALAILPGDLAAPEPGDICRFLRHGMKTGQPVLCPSTDNGTNAILVAPPGAIAFQYGPNSAIHHQRALEAAGFAPILMPLESLRFDIDTSACLDSAAAQDPALRAIKGDRA